MYNRNADIVALFVGHTARVCLCTGTEKSSWKKFDVLCVLSHFIVYFPDICPVVPKYGPFSMSSYRLHHLLFGTGLLLLVERPLL